MGSSLISFFHLFSCNFWSYSYPNFPPVYRWVGLGIIFYGSRFDFRFRSALRVRLSHQSWFPLHLTPGFFGRVVSLVVDLVKVQNSRHSSASSLLIFQSPSDRKVGKDWNWLIIWMEFSLFNFYTLGITVTAKSHWFPQLLPIIYKCYFGTFVCVTFIRILIDWFQGHLTLFIYYS